MAGFPLRRIRRCSKYANVTINVSKHLHKNGALVAISKRRIERTFFSEDVPSINRILNPLLQKLYDEEALGISIMAHSMLFLCKPPRQTGHFLLVALIWINILTGAVVLALFDPKSVAVEVIRQNGYPVQEHVNIETADGYLLDMQRIPHGLKNANVTNKPAVLLMHGILGSAENWLVTGPEKGLAFILADQGYDVWLGNARGTTHSRKHRQLSPSWTTFWQFSWHEIGMYDLPAKIDYIIQETGQPKIFYIGHSQGTTSFFVMASERPNYNTKIRLMIALAPVAYMSHLNNLFLQIVSRFGNGINWILSLIGATEFLPSSRIMSLAGQTLCSETVPVQEICTNALFLIAGYDSTEMNRTALPAILSASPAGASTKQILHYAQEINSGSFRYYDYGLLMNLYNYGSMSPPSYSPNKVTAPVVLFYAKNDWLVAIRDAQKLAAELPNVVYSYLIPYERFNHLDFLWASNVVQMLYYQVLDLLREF